MCCTWKSYIAESVSFLDILAVNVDCEIKAQ